MFQALAAVDGVGGKKEKVVKGFVGNLTKGAGSGAVGAGGHDARGGGGGGGGTQGDWNCPRCSIKYLKLLDVIGAGANGMRGLLGGVIHEGSLMLDSNRP